MEQAESPRIGKRLVVACDGTWMDSDNGFQRDSYLPWDTSGHLQTPSNVTRMCRALRTESIHGIPQIVFYQAGIGSENNFFDHVVGGCTGAGISEHIREAYAFIADNYQTGDEIFLIGFSRGAFTARSVASLICDIGLLTKHGMEDFYMVFKDWENQVNPRYVTKFPDKPFPDRPNATDPRYARELERLGLSRLNIRVRAVAVWDTVGSLGIPNIGLWPSTNQEFAFTSNQIDSNVEYAFQALALDELRRPFAPSVWEKPAGNELPVVLKQCWFPGVHSNIGGSYDDTGLADITLAWMISQLDGLLDFDPNYITWQHERNIHYYQKTHQPHRPWALSKIYNSMTGLQVLGRRKVRTPGRYCATDPVTGVNTDRPLHHTNQRIHSSVRIRMELGGKGAEDKGKYKPMSLDGWKMVKDGEEASNENGNGVTPSKNPFQDPVEPSLKWEYRDAHGGPTHVLYEDELGSMELKLLAKSPQIFQRVVHS